MMTRVGPPRLMEPFPEATTHGQTVEAGRTGVEPRPLSKVLVLGMSVTGLATVRLLGRAGIDCWGFDFEDNLPGYRSRYCHLLPRLSPDAKDQEVLVALLEYDGWATDLPLLLPTSDRFVWFIHRFRTQLASRFRLILPDSRVLEDLIDKFRFTERAAELNLPVPHTFTVANAGELPGRLAEEAFPLIVRPRQRCDSDGSFPKAVVLRSRADASQVAKTFAERPHPELLVQEFIEGPTESQISVAVLVNQGHQTVATFSARKVRQGSDVVGVGTYLESCHDAEAERLAAHFLERIGYCGLAEVEFKRQPSTGKLFALEVNPRLWEQVSLPAACGLNFPKMLLELANGTPSQIKVIDRRPHGWQDLWGDFYWTFRRGGYWRKGQVSLAAWLWQTLAARAHAHLAWSDPLPAAHRFLQVLRELTKR